MRSECGREQEILDAIASEYWPDELVAHRRSCDVCGDLATLAALLRDEGNGAAREARVPTAGQVWWRATMKRRAEARAAAARPITMAQGLTAACATGLAAGILTKWWPSAWQPMAWIAAVLGREGTPAGTVTAPGALVDPALLALAALAGVCLIAAPLALYLALSDE
jgi:hypothetical protein